MRKGYDGEKKTGKKIMMKIVAPNVVASRPPEWRPTGTSTACANNSIHNKFVRQHDLMTDYNCTCPLCVEVGVGAGK